MCGVFSKCIFIQECKKTQNSQLADREEKTIAVEITGLYDVPIEQP